MSFIYEFSWWLHITAGAIALVLFWVPVVSHKGGMNHKRFGKIYQWSMLLVAYSGILMAALVAFVPAEVKPGNATAATAQTQLFAWFLAYLGLLIIALAHYGQHVVLAKQNRALLRANFIPALLVLLCLNGILLLITGLAKFMPLLVAFGVLGTHLSVSSLRYIFRQTVAPSQWLKEHLGAFLGSGIAAYTAFFVFGGSRLLSLPGYWYLLLWLGPGVVGSILIARWSRRYA